MAYKQQTFISLLEAGKFQIMAPTDSVSDEGPLPHRWYYLSVSSHNGRVKGSLSQEEVLQKC